MEIRSGVELAEGFHQQDQRVGADPGETQGVPGAVGPRFHDRQRVQMGLLAPVVGPHGQVGRRGLLFPPDLRQKKELLVLALFEVRLFEVDPGEDPEFGGRTAEGGGGKQGCQKCFLHHFISPHKFL